MAAGGGVLLAPHDADGFPVDGVVVQVLTGPGKKEATVVHIVPLDRGIGCMEPTPEAFQLRGIHDHS